MSVCLKVRVRESVRDIVSDRERVCRCVCERERVCVCERERVCVCVTQRKIEKDIVCTM